MGSLDTHGGFCNVCGRALKEDHTHYSHSQMQRAVRHGLRPRQNVLPGSQPGDGSKSKKV